MAAVVVQAGAVEQAPMRFEEVLDRDVVARADHAEGPRHGPDIAENLGRSHIRRALTERRRGLGPQEPTTADLQALDAGRPDRLRPQQQPGQRLGVSQHHGTGIEAGDGGARRR
jgi:hypothetical protein